MPITTERFVVIEAESRAGVDPSVTFHDTKDSARAHVMDRIYLFDRFDVAKVIARVTVTYERQIAEAEEE